MRIYTRVIGVLVASWILAVACGRKEESGSGQEGGVVPVGSFDLRIEVTKGRSGYAHVRAEAESPIAPVERLEWCAFDNIEDKTLTGRMPCTLGRSARAAGRLYAKAGEGPASFEVDEWTSQRASLLACGGKECVPYMALAARDVSDDSSVVRFVPLRPKDKSVEETKADKPETHFGNAGQLEDEVYEGPVVDIQGRPAYAPGGEIFWSISKGRGNEVAGGEYCFVALDDLGGVVEGSGETCAEAQRPDIAPSDYIEILSTLPEADPGRMAKFRFLARGVNLAGVWSNWVKVDLLIDAKPPVMLFRGPVMTYAGRRANFELAFTDEGGVDDTSIRSCTVVAGGACPAGSLRPGEPCRGVKSCEPIHPVDAAGSVEAVAVPTTVPEGAPVQGTVVLCVGVKDWAGNETVDCAGTLLSDNAGECTPLFVERTDLHLKEEQITKRTGRALNLDHVIKRDTSAMGKWIMSDCEGYDGPVIAVFPIRYELEKPTVGPKGALKYCIVDVSGDEAGACNPEEGREASTCFDGLGSDRAETIECDRDIAIPEPRRRLFYISDEEGEKGADPILVGDCHKKECTKLVRTLYYDATGNPGVVQETVLTIDEAAPKIAVPQGEPPPVPLKSVEGKDAVYRFGGEEGEPLWAVDSDPLASAAHFIEVKALGPSGEQARLYGYSDGRLFDIAIEVSPGQYDFTFRRCLEELRATGKVNIPCFGLGYQLLRDDAVQPPWRKVIRDEVECLSTFGCEIRVHMSLMDSKHNVAEWIGAWQKVEGKDVNGPIVDAFPVQASITSTGKWKLSVGTWLASDYGTGVQDGYVKLLPTSSDPYCQSFPGLGFPVTRAGDPCPDIEGRACVEFEGMDVEFDPPLARSVWRPDVPSVELPKRTWPNLCEYEGEGSRTIWYDDRGMLRGRYCCRYDAAVLNEMETLVLVDLVEEETEVKKTPRRDGDSGCGGTTVSRTDGDVDPVSHAMRNVRKGCSIEGGGSFELLTDLLKTGQVTRENFENAVNSFGQAFKERCEPAVNEFIRVRMEEARGYVQNWVTGAFQSTFCAAQTVKRLGREISSFLERTLNGNGGRPRSRGDRLSRSAKLSQATLCQVLDSATTYAGECLYEECPGGWSSGVPRDVKEIRATIHAAKNAVAAAELAAAEAAAVGPPACNREWEVCAYVNDGARHQGSKCEPIVFE